MSPTRFTIPRFLPPTECRRLIEATETRGFGPAPITTSQGPMMAPHVRNNTRVMFDDEELASTLWDALHPHVTTCFGRVAVGLNERFRFYRYDPGQSFEWHYDGSFRRDAHEESELTFMIYLNGGFEGGATEFEDDVIVPEEGLALVFAHGIRHRGARVRRGRKYVLRSDVMFRD